LAAAFFAGAFLAAFFAAFLAGAFLVTFFLAAMVFVKMESLKRPEIRQSGSAGGSH